MKRNLLIHSLSELKSIYLPILELVKPKLIGEIGVEFGGNTKVLIDFLEKNHGKLHSIDPFPDFKIKELFNSLDNLTLHENTSLNVIKNLPKIPVWFIDGDHNWYTVYNELVNINDKNYDVDDTIIFLHDVGFPCARRDQYYNPGSIPKSFLNDYCWDSGVLIDNSTALNRGFRGCGQFAIALNCGNKRNGVLTAVEDFLALSENSYNFYNIPAVFGLGVLVKKNHSMYEQINSILSFYHNNDVLKILEDNRLNNYFKVIELQDEKH